MASEHHILRVITPSRSIVLDDRDHSLRAILSQSDLARFIFDNLGMETEQFAESCQLIAFHLRQTTLVG